MENTIENATALTIEQRNANSKKEAMQAAKNAVLELYKHDRIAFLHACLFDKSDRAYTQIVKYTAYKSENGENVPFTANARLKVTLFDFVTEKETKHTLKEQIAIICEKASIGNDAVKSVIPYIKNVCTILGMKDCSESVNERDAKRILKATYTVTDKNDDNARATECKRAVCAMLWAMTEKHDTVNAYRAAQEQKKNANK